MWNGNFISTPCRLVFDASQPTASEWSLNILANGKNNMNKLVEIVICWSIHKIGFSLAWSESQLKKKKKKKIQISRKCITQLN